MKSILVSAILIAGFASALFAQQFDGLYHPNFGKAQKWHCTADFVGSDGGAMQILGNELWEVETRCNLHDQRELGETGIYSYSASCASEGTVYRTEMFIAEYEMGVLVANDNGINDWRSCDFQTEEQDLSLTLGPTTFIGATLD